MESLPNNNIILDNDDTSTIDSNINYDLEIKTSQVIKGPPSEIINKSYYYELYDDEKKKIFIKINKIF